MPLPATVIPVLKLRALEVVGCRELGKRRKLPVAEGLTAVRLAATATAPAGMPQAVATWSSRCSPGSKAPSLARLSYRRQGVIVWKKEAGTRVVWPKAGAPADARTA